MTDWIPDWMTVQMLRALLIVLLGWPGVRLLAGLLRRQLTKHSTPQATMLGYRLILYGGGVIVALSAMAELGFKLSTLLGAAGIAGVAIAFATQTTLSNMISGIFLIWEKPFGVEDVIKIGDTTGVVLAIDLLSTKLRTFDNTLVRIPNENLLKSQLTNLTRFAIRRLDVKIGVSYKEDVGRVIAVLKDVADQNPWCLDEPEPMVVFLGFGESALEFNYGVWAAKADFLKLRNSILQQVKERFDLENIEIPYPHIKIVSDTPAAPAEK
jgi:small-conductance mechanosensitive channel